MGAMKFFSFALSYDTYKTLKKVSHTFDQPIAETVRTAIKFYLAELKSCKQRGEISKEN